MSVTEGTRVLGERYRLEERIGVGGMAEVWRARDMRLDRDVAVKLVPAATRSDKLQREARALAASQHPNVVEVYDAGETDDGAYIVMELVEGQNLSELLAERGPLPVEEAESLIAGIAAGVAHAHAAGVVHGDIKPANVFVGGHGPKVGDFGVARILDEETGTTTIAATPAYAAPEVLRGQRATAASDVYSIGCLAFHALTGRQPFRGSNGWEIAAKHLDEPVPSVRAFRTDVPADLDARIKRAMDKSPQRRFSDATDIIAAAAAPATAAAPLRDPADEMTQPVERPTSPMPDMTERLQPPPSRPRRPLRVALIAIGVVLFIIAAFARAGTDAPTDRRVPNVVGDQYRLATAQLQQGGYIVDVSFRPVTGGDPGIVLETIPEAGATVAEGSTINVIVSIATATPAPSIEAQPEKTGSGGGKGKGRRERDD